MCCTRTVNAYALKAKFILQVSIYYYNQHHFPLYIPEEFDNGKSFAIIRILLFLSLYLTAPIAKLNANNGVDFIFDMNEALRVSVLH